MDAWGADAELIATARDCLASEAEDRPRHAGAVAEQVTAYLGGVQDRLRTAEIARAAEAARAEEAVHTAAEANERDRARREAGDPGAWRDALAALERAEGQGPEVEVLRDEIPGEGKLAEAVAECRSAIRLQPDFADAHNGLAFPLLELGDIAGAMRSIREALRLDPRHAPALSTLSETLLVAGRFGEAVPALERVADGRGLSAALMAHYKGLIPKARWLAAHVAPPAAPAADAPAGPTAIDLAARALADDRPALAARIYELVLAASPARAGDLDTWPATGPPAPPRGPAAAATRTTRHSTRPSGPNCVGWPSAG